jgi:hypothetical protein
MQTEMQWHKAYQVFALHDALEKIPLGWAFNTLGYHPRSSNVNYM